jgi:hypothetical protein
MGSNDTTQDAEPRPKFLDALGLELKSIEIDHHRSEPRWIFARFLLNVAKALAESTPVQTSSTKARFSTC